MNTSKLATALVIVGGVAGCGPALGEPNEVGRARVGSAAASGACPAAFDPQPAAPPAPPPALADPRAGEALAPAWEARPRAGATLAFDGVVDRAGHVYWREVDVASGEAELVSATRDGEERWRAPGPPAPVALAGGALVSAFVEPGRCGPRGNPVLEGRGAQDGARRWRVELLPLLEPWLRSAPGAGSCRFGGLAGLAAAPARVLVAASVLDRATGEHESGYVELDPATGAVLRATRTSSPGNVMPAGAPVLAEDQVGYGSRTVDYRRDELLAFPPGAAPRPLAEEPEPWHGAPRAAYGALLVAEATGGVAFGPPPRGLEVRCRRDGSRVLAAGGLRGLPLLAAGALWAFGDELARWDAASGALAWRIALGAPPAAASRRERPLVLRSWPIALRGGAVAFTEQPAVAAPAPEPQRLGAPVLRVVDAAGVEVLRRTLPLEPEGYQGPAAAHRGRLFLAGQVEPAAGARGVLRAFDVPGLAPASRGWISVNGSMAGDRRAR